MKNKTDKFIDDKIKESCRLVCEQISQELEDFYKHGSFLHDLVAKNVKSKKDK